MSWNWDKPSDFCEHYQFSTAEDPSESLLLLPMGFSSINCRQPLKKRKNQSCNWNERVLMFCRTIQRRCSISVCSLLQSSCRCAIKSCFPPLVNLKLFPPQILWHLDAFECRIWSPQSHLCVSSYFKLEFIYINYIYIHKYIYLDTYIHIYKRKNMQ